MGSVNWFTIVEISRTPIALGQLSGFPMFPRVDQVERKKQQSEEGKMLTLSKRGECTISPVSTFSGLVRSRFGVALGNFHS